MAFVLEKLVKQGASMSAAAPTLWTYSSDTDSLSTIIASGYFDAAVNVLSQDDIIYASQSPSFGRYTSARVITSATGVAPITTDGAIGPDSFAEAALFGSAVRPVSDSSTASGMLVFYPVLTTGGPSFELDVIIDDKIRVVDIIVQNNAIGTTSDTVTIKNGADAISNAIDISGADKTIARVGTIDDAFATINSGGTLRIAEVDGGGNDSPPVLVTVIGQRLF